MALQRRIPCEGHEEAHRIRGEAENEQLLNCPELISAARFARPSSWGMGETQLIVSALFPPTQRGSPWPGQWEEMQNFLEEEGRHLDFMFHQDDFQQREAHLQIKWWFGVAKMLKSITVTFISISEALWFLTRGKETHIKMWWLGNEKRRGGKNLLL